MAKITIGIFFNTDQTLEHIRDECAVILNTTAILQSDDEELWYEFEIAPFWVTFGEHTFVNDGELDFENFTYDLTIWTYHSKYTAALELAQMVFSIFRDKGYQLMMVEDVQIILDRTE